MATKNLKFKIFKLINQKTKVFKYNRFSRDYAVKVYYNRILKNCLTDKNIYIIVFVY